jgi:hypothetical protein
MSSTSSFTTSKPVFKKFCKVCQDAGKLESEYTSHNVRESKDPKSKTLCPTLLAQECRHCFRKGHTVKYCSILKKQQTPPTSYVGTSDNKKKKNEITNVFMLLESESEGEEEMDTQEVLTDKKPALDYTSIIRITMEQQKEQSQTQEQTQVQVKPKAVVPAVRVIGKSRWLDVVSSSDEDDSEEE